MQCGLGVSVRHQGEHVIVIFGVVLPGRMFVKFASLNLRIATEGFAVRFGRDFFDTTDDALSPTSSSGARKTRSAAPQRSGLQSV